MYDIGYLKARRVLTLQGMAPLGAMRVNLFPSSTSGLPPSEITIAEQTKEAGYENGFFGMCAIILFVFCSTCIYLFYLIDH